MLRLARAVRRAGVRGAAGGATWVDTFDAAVRDLREVRRGREGLSVCVGLSGGVDSSVTALLLREAGFRVRGVFMSNWSRSDESEDSKEPCPIEQDWMSAQAVGRSLGIPVSRVDFSRRYWTHVFEPFLSDYAAVRPAEGCGCQVGGDWRGAAQWVRIARAGANPEPRRALQRAHQVWRVP
jgi:hypothetical protein